MSGDYLPTYLRHPPNPAQWKITHALYCILYCIAIVYFQSSIHSILTKLTERTNENDNAEMGWGERQSRYCMYMDYFPQTSPIISLPDQCGGSEGGRGQTRPRIGGGGGWGSANLKSWPFTLYLMFDRRPHGFWSHPIVLYICTVHTYAKRVIMLCMYVSYIIIIIILMPLGEKKN